MVLLENISYVQQTPKKKNKVLVKRPFFLFFGFLFETDRCWWSWLWWFFMFHHHHMYPAFHFVILFEWAALVARKSCLFPAVVRDELAIFYFFLIFFFHFCFIFLFFWWICIAFSHVFIYFNAKVHCHYILVLHAAEIQLQWWQITLQHKHSCSGMFL